MMSTPKANQGSNFVQLDAGRSLRQNQAAATTGANFAIANEARVDIDSINDCPAWHNQLTRPGRSHLVTKPNQPPQHHFLNNLSHEFRTSLSIIYGYLQGILNREQNLTPAQRKAIGISLLETDRLVAILQQLLDLERAKNNLSVTPLATVSINQLCAEVVQIANQTWSNPLQLLPPVVINQSWAGDRDLAKMFQAAFGCDQDLHQAQAQSNPNNPSRSGGSGSPVNHEITALADYNYLKQALLLLIENAARYSEPDQPIMIRSLQLRTANQTGINLEQQSTEVVEQEPEQAASRIIIQLSDRGCGIPPADQHRIFEPLYRVERSRNRETGGIGIGLAMVKALVEAMAGEVFVHSEVGKGSMFSIVLRSAKV
jgi:signal transduction histidine kinase